MILIISISFFFLSLILICFYIVGWRQTSAWGELCEINRQLLCGLFSPSATELFCFLAVKRYSFESLSGSHYYWISFFFVKIFHRCWRICIVDIFTKMFSSLDLMLNRGIRIFVNWNDSYFNICNIYLINFSEGLQNNT